MLLTNDYQGAQQREPETRQWTSKAASCSSVWSIYFKMCSSLLIIYDTSQHTVSGSQHIL